MEVLSLYMFNPFLERPEHITPGLLGYMYTQTDSQTHTHTHTHTHTCMCVCHTCIYLREGEKAEKEKVCKVCAHTCIHGSTNASTGMEAQW